MANVTKQDGKWVRQREVKQSQVGAALGQARDLVSQWRDDAQAMTEVQRWQLVRVTFILLLRGMIYLIEREMRRR